MVTVRVRDWLVLGNGSEKGVSVLICPSEPSRERFKVSHVINECRVINHHPGFLVYSKWQFTLLHIIALAT